MQLASGRLWRRVTFALVFLASVFPLPASARAPSVTEAGVPAIAAADLPPEARHTIVLIRRGGPFPFERDGVGFRNFEGILPQRDRGYYREYTVVTPGVAHRGARRIVAGRRGELYYTDDHYRSFRRIRE